MCLRPKLRRKMAQNPAVPSGCAHSAMRAHAATFSLKVCGTGTRFRAFWFMFIGTRGSSAPIAGWSLHLCGSWWKLLPLLWPSPLPTASDSGRCGPTSLWPARTKSDQKRKKKSIEVREKDFILFWRSAWKSWMRFNVIKNHGVKSEEELHALCLRCAKQMRSNANVVMPLSKYCKTWTTIEAV